MTFEILKKLLQVPDLADKKWIYEQYDSQVMNDTIITYGDASIVRIHDSKKAIAMSVDCTPRYVEADSYLGAIQAVSETYRNISAVGAKPLAITNCLNFGNPQKPEIMGQIVRSIQGINEACKALDYPVVSGNVSLYNETDGKSILPTPSIGGVGLLTDVSKRCDIKFKHNGDKIIIIGETHGHISCSLYEREILGIESKKNPPITNLEVEKRNSEFIRELISKQIINACHDISDGGIMIALFEMCSNKFGCKIDISQITKNNIDNNSILFGEDQSRYIISINDFNYKEFNKIAEKFKINHYNIGEVIADNIEFKSELVSVNELQKISQSVYEKHFN
jgi:phosphoribosylformylglycinamidine synthase